MKRNVIKHPDGTCMTCVDDATHDVHLRGDDGSTFWVAMCKACNDQVRAESDSPATGQPLIDRIMLYRDLWTA
jgi:predicted metal-binding protein